MNNELFSVTVKRVCSGITGKQKRAEIEEELLDHLEDTYERNIAVGKSDDEAQREAVAALGDLKIMSDRLQKLHSFSHAGAAASSIYLFIFAFLLIKINLFPAYSTVINFAASAIMLLALVRLRKADRFFLFAFQTAWLFMLFSAILGGMTAFTDAVALKMAAAVITNVTRGIFFSFSFAGFRSLYRRFCDTENKKINLSFPMVVLTAGSVISGIVLLFNRGEALQIDSILLGGSALIFYIYCCIQLIRLHNRLWDADAQYGVTPWGKSAVSKVLLVTLLGLLLPLSCQLWVSTSEPKTAELMIHDTQSDMSRARNNMAALGFPRQYLDELPDSEAAHYADAKYMTAETHIVSDMETEIFHFYFYHANELEPPHIRTVFRMKTNGDTLQKPYVGGIYLDAAQYPINGNYMPTTQHDFFTQVISYRDGKAFLQQSAKKVVDESAQYSFYSLLGTAFRFEENQAVYLALTNEVRSSGMLSYGNMTVTVTEQVQPFSVQYPNMVNFMRSVNFGDIFNDSDDFCMQKRYMMIEIVYDPTYVGLPQDDPYSADSD